MAELNKAIEELRRELRISENNYYMLRKDHEYLIADYEKLKKLYESK